MLIGIVCQIKILEIRQIYIIRPDIDTGGTPLNHTNGLNIPVTFRECQAEF